MNIRHARFVANSAWLFLAQFGTAFTGVLVAALVARHLGPVDFGKLAYAYSMAAMFGTVGKLGMEGLVVCELRRAPEKASETLGTVVGLQVLAFAFVAMLLLIFAYRFPGHDDVDRMVFTLAALFSLFTGFKGLSEWFHSRLEGRMIALSHLASWATSSAFKIVLIFFSAGVVWFAAVNVINILILAILMLIAFRRSGGPAVTSWRFSWTTARRLMAEGGVVLIAGIFAAIYLKIDLLLLRWLSNENSVGAYAVAAQISEATYLIPGAIVASVFAHLIELKETNPDAYDLRFQQVLDILVLLAICIVAGTYLFGGMLLNFLFGKAYTASAAILLIHILAVPFIFMRYLFSRWILIEHVVIYSLLTQGMGALANVALNLALIPQMAGQGAAIATVISYIAASYLSLAVWDRTRPIFNKMSRSLFMPWRAAARVICGRANIIDRSLS